MEIAGRLGFSHFLHVPNKMSFVFQNTDTTQNFQTPEISGKFKIFCKYLLIKAEAKSIPKKGQVLIGNV
jgi:hypothetical protein